MNCPGKVLCKMLEGKEYNEQEEGRKRQMKKVDARGLSCPEPVIRAKNAMESGDKEYEILVDNVVAKENVSRFATHQGYQVKVEEQGDDILLKITK